MSIHRRDALTPDEVTVHRGIPVTTPARTIVDLSRSVKGRRLEQLVDLADQRGLIDFQQLRAANSASLQAVLLSYSDGYADHRSPGAFEADRERDVTLTTRGWRVLRFTWAQIARRAAWVAAAIRA